MTLTQFLLILRARWMVVAAILLVAIGGTFVATKLWPKTYTAVATIVVDFKGTDPVLGVMLPMQMMPGYLATQVEIIKSHKVAVEAVRLLKLTNTAEARQGWTAATGGRGTVEDWLADVLLKNLDAKPARDSSLVDVSFDSADPQFAALVANAFADAYQRVNLELRVEPAKQSATWFDEQLSTLKGDLETSQAELTKYQREKSIHATDERLDVENSKLSELSSSYSQTQTATFDLQSRQRQLREFLAAGNDPATLPDVLANPLVQQLKGGLAQSEARLEQISSQLGANHPEVRRLKADIAAQREKLREEIKNVSASINNMANLALRREAELRDAVADQKSRLLRLNQRRDEMAGLIRAVDAAQRAYDAAATRFTQTNLESQTTLTNIAVLNRAVPPLGPSSPRLMLNLAIAAAAGLFLAIGVAMVLELVDRRVRSEADLSSYFEFPLIGALEKARGKRTRLGRLFAFRRRVGPAPA